jgi:tryptophanyl-tRNA synthetase
MLDAEGKPMTKNQMKKALKLAEQEKKKREKEAAKK